MIGWTEAKTRPVVRTRSMGCCEICGAYSAVHMHHRLNRSQGGQWHPANIMHLCVECHGYVTTHPDDAKNRGWTIPHGEDAAPAEIPVQRYSRYLGQTERVRLHDDGTIEGTAA